MFAFLCESKIVSYNSDYWEGETLAVGLYQVSTKSVAYTMFYMNC
jgi:hypothetical protein